MTGPAAPVGWSEAELETLAVLAEAFVPGQASRRALMAAEAFDLGLDRRPGPPDPVGAPSARVASGEPRPRRPGGPPERSRRRVARPVPARLGSLAAGPAPIGLPGLPSPAQLPGLRRPWRRRQPEPPPGGDRLRPGRPRDDRRPDADRAAPPARAGPGGRAADPGSRRRHRWIGGRRRGDGPGAGRGRAIGRRRRSRPVRARARDASLRARRVRPALPRPRPDRDLGWLGVDPGRSRRRRRDHRQLDDGDRRTRRGPGRLGPGARDRGLRRGRRRRRLRHAVDRALGDRLHRPAAEGRCPRPRRRRARPRGGPDRPRRDRLPSVRVMPVRLPGGIQAVRIAGAPRRRLPVGRPGPGRRPGRAGAHRRRAGGRRGGHRRLAGAVGPDRRRRDRSDRAPGGGGPRPAGRPGGRWPAHAGHPRAVRRRPPSARAVPPAPTRAGARGHLPGADRHVARAAAGDPLAGLRRRQSGGGTATSSNPPRVIPG